MTAEHGYYFEDLEIGMSESYTRTVTAEDIQLFADVSGDTNPVHLNEEFAANSRFEQRIAHGMLTGSYISTIIGTRLPGPGCLYLNQSMKFKNPVFVNDEVTATATITRLDTRRKFVTFETICRVGDTSVIEGEALIWVPSRESE